MPLYDYDCAQCGRRFEIVHGVHVDGPTECPLCGGGPVRKAITAAAVHYKGSGWAKKERRSTSKSARSDGDGGTTSDGGTSGVGTGGARTDGDSAKSGTAESGGSDAAKTDTAKTDAVKTDAAKTDHAKGAGTTASSSD